MNTTFIALIVVRFAAAPLPSTVTIAGLPDLPACATLLVQQSDAFRSIGGRIDALTCVRGEVVPEPPTQDGTP